MWIILLCLNLIFSLLNLVLLIPLVKMVLDQTQATRAATRAARKEETGLVDPVPAVNYHRMLPPPVDLE